MPAPARYSARSARVLCAEVWRGYVGTARWSNGLDRADEPKHGGPGSWLAVGRFGRGPRRLPISRAVWHSAFASGGGRGWNGAGGSGAWRWIWVRDRSSI